MTPAAARARRLLWNPILAREIRSRMRGVRAPLTLTVYLVLVGGAGWLSYRGENVSLADPLAPTVAGGHLFATLFGCVMGLTLLITPGLCASAISSERERQTLDLLLCTPMGAARIVLGKLLSSLLFVLLLIVAAIPLFALVFLLGGVTAGQVLVALTVCAGAALLAGSIGLLCSSLLRRTPAATLLAYLLLVGVIMLPVAFGFFSSGFGATRVTGYAPTQCGDVFGASPCSPAGPPGTATVLLESTSPLTPTVAAMQTLPTSTGSCVNVPVIIGTPYNGGPYNVISPSAGCSTTALADRDVVQGSRFGGWRVWEVSLLGQGILVVLCLGAAIVALGSPRSLRRPRWARGRMGPESP